MVKGISRQVVVIDAPDEKLFEQAIFIVRNDALKEGVTARALVQEARRVAKNCTSERKADSLWTRYMPLVSACMGGGAVGLLWFFMSFCAV